MFEKLKALFHSSRAMSTEQIVGLAIGVLLLGVLLPVGLAQWESYTPTNPILLVIWPIGAVLIEAGHPRFKN